MMKRVFVFYVNRFTGHKFVADSIIEALCDFFPDCEIIEVVIADLFKFSRYTRSLIFSLRLRLSAIWNFLHGFYPLRKLCDIIRPLLFHLFSYVINRRWVLESAYLISTHAFPTYIFSYAREKRIINSPIFAFITDYDIHPYWINRGVDAYFVPTDYVAEMLVKSGIKCEKIKVIGMPLRKEIMFSIEQSHAKELLGFGKDKKVVVILGGSSGIFPFRKIIDVLSKIATDEYEFAIVTGANHGEFLKLKRRKLDPRFHFYSFVNINAFLEAADVIVTKPGGVTLAEAIFKNKPIIMVQSLHAQERKNELYILKSKLGIRCRRLEDLPKMLCAFPKPPLGSRGSSHNLLKECISYIASYQG